MYRARTVHPGVLGLVLVASAPAGAAEYYNLPLVTLSVEHHTNVDLEVDTGLPENVTGYRGLLQDIFGILTSTSDTQFRPRLILQRYSERPDLSRTNEFLDMKSKYQSQRSLFEFYGAASRQDSYLSETLNPQFDDFNPHDPVTGQSGKIDIGNVRTSVYFLPRYSYDLTRLTSIGASVEYMQAHFRSDLPGSEVSFDYGLANAFLSNKLSAKTDIITGLYASDYQTRDKAYKDDAYGLSFELDHEWTQVITGSLTLQAERDDLTEFPLVKAGSPVVSSNFSGTNYGAFLSVQYKAQVSLLRLTAGRQLVPSSAGTVEGVNQIRIQYDRHWTPRLTLTEAVLAERQAAISNIGAINAGNDHNDQVALFNATWALSATFFVEGQYSYTHSKYVTDTQPANDQMVRLSVGYRGLGAQR